MKTQLVSTVLSAWICFACGAEGGDPPVNMTEQPLCERGLLEPDRASLAPLAGPAVDPATNALRAPPAEGWVISSTYLTLKNEAAAQMRFLELMGPIERELATLPGLLAIELSSSMNCGTARTFSVWESEEAMFDFVAGPAHGAARAAVGEVSRGGSVVTHWRTARAEESTWEEAAARLAADEGPLY
jgi:heme-degrading monooxygenase HmoA